MASLLKIDKFNKRFIIEASASVFVFVLNIIMFREAIANFKDNHENRQLLKFYECSINKMAKEAIPDPTEYSDIT